MVEPDRAEIRRVVRTGDGWARHVATGLDAGAETLGVAVALEDVYRLVAFDD